MIHFGIGVLIASTGLSLWKHDALYVGVAAAVMLAVVLIDLLKSTRL